MLYYAIRLTTIILPLLSILFYNFTYADCYSLTIIKNWEPIVLHHFDKTTWNDIATIIIKKRSYAPLYLSTISLQWNGTFIPHMIGSLYRKKPSQPFFATENVTYADGTWNKKNQSLTFSFNTPISISAHEELHLIVYIVDPKSSSIKEGKFTLKYHDITCPPHKNRIP